MAAAGRTAGREDVGTMVIWWCVLGVVLAVVYMVTYTLLRTSGDGRRWSSRLLHPRARPARHRGGRGPR